MPVTTIPLSTMVTSVTTGSTVSPVMADSAGLNSISIMSSAGGAQALKSGSNSMLGCDTGAITPAGKSLCSSLLPSGDLLRNAPPSAMQATTQAGIPFGLKNTSSLRPLNLLQCSEQGLTAQEQALTAQQAAVINLAGVGGFTQSQATVLSQLGSAENRTEQSLPPQTLQLSSAFQQQQQQQQLQQLRFLQHQMAMAAAAAQTAQLHRHRHAGGQSKSKMKRGMPTTPKF